MKEWVSMNNGDVIQEIVVDFRNGKGLVGYGFGDGSGRVDKRQGRPKRFEHPLMAMDWAELVAETHKRIDQRHFPDRMRPVKICVTPAYWAWVESEKARLDAQAAGEVGP